MPMQPQRQPNRVGSALLTPEDLPAPTIKKPLGNQFIDGAAGLERGV
jgi:hypothetical protein